MGLATHPIARLWSVYVHVCCVCLLLSVCRLGCLHDLAFGALNMMLVYLAESGLNERPHFLLTFCPWQD